MNEGLARKTRSLREIPEEVRRKNNIQKMKSSTEMVVAACAISKFLAEREMRTSSTGSIYYTEEYVDYNKFLSYLVELLKDLGSSWLPEGDLIFKCDEGISQASIRDTATRASLVNMSNLSPHVFNLMKDQRRDSARFFGRMCEAFLTRRLPADVLENVKKRMWEEGQCDSLFESTSSLGLNNKVKKKFDDKTSGNMIEEMGILDLKGFKELFCEEFSKIKYFENVHIGHDIGIGKFHHTFIFCHIIPSLKDTVNDVICRLCHETKKFRVMFSCKKCRPKKAELLGQIHANGIISYSFGVYKKSPDDFKFFTDDKEQADMTISNVIEAKRYVEECLDDIVESLSLKEDFSLGLSKKVQKRHSEKSIDDIKELHTLSPDKFKEKLIKYIFENYNITKREENFNNRRYSNYNYYIDKGVRILFEKRSECGISIILDETNQKFLMYVVEKKCMYTFREEMVDISVEGWFDKYGYNGSDKDDYAFDLTLDNMHRLVDFGLEERCGFKKIQKIEESNLGLSKKVKNKFDFDKANTVDNISDYIDLGLPNGTLWSKHNYGADENEYGDLYNHDDAKKLNLRPGILPSKEDFSELYDNCTHKWITIDGTSGELFTSKINGNSVFFPAAGEESYTSHNRGNQGFYWASSSHIPVFPDALFFNRNDSIYLSSCYHKNMKFSVRPIVKKSNESINLGLNSKVKKKFDNVDAVDNVSQIPFEDSEVERICHEHGVYTVNDAAKVLSIKGWFKENETIKSFNELKFFASLKTIECEAFDHCKYLQSITIPSSVTSIGIFAFFYCVALQSVNIPENVSSIEAFAFSCCDALQSVIIPSSVAKIGGNVFGGCKSLQTISISKNCPVYKKIKKQYPTIQLIEPKVNESSNLGLNNKVKNKFEKVNAIDNVSQIQFEDPEVERICHEHGVYTYDDAANVEYIDEYWFKHSSIKSFNEFKYFTGLRELDYIFKYCESLKTITIPNSVSSIGEYAFYNCVFLQSINIPDSVISIKDRAFYKCKSLQSINIPEGVTKIGRLAFFGCESLQSFKNPESLHHIWYSAFAYCSSLQSINIPDNVSKLGDKVFEGCDSLETIYISNNHFLRQKLQEQFQYIKLVDPNEVNESNLGFNKKIQKKFNDVNNIDNIGQIPFEDPEVEHICHDHEVYTIADATKVSSIEEWFEANKSIKSFNELKWFTGIETIENQAFYKCSSLQSINIPNSVTSIGVNAFAWCDSLQLVNIPDSVTSIEGNAFAWCKSLQSIAIPNSVTSIKNYAFAWCESLQSITIPNSVTSIGSYAFVWCESLQSIIIPNSVTTIEERAFAWCRSLQSIAIPNSVTSIGVGTFEVCDSLKSITIPNSVTSIGGLAFAKCESLKTISISKNCPVYEQIRREYPAIQLIEPKVNESSNLGLNNKVKKKFDKVDAIDNVAYIKFEDPEVERICHEHGVYTYDDADRVTSIKDWFSDIGNIKTFDEFKYFTGLKTIEDEAFWLCDVLQSITIPNSVTSIGDCAFRTCKSLQSINIPDSVTHIGAWSFGRCTSLQSINIPNSVTSIGSEAFHDCRSIHSVIIPDSVTSIGDHAFGYCESLQSIAIPNSVISIGISAFAWCTSLKTISISKNCPVYEQIRREYPAIQLIEPKVNESSNLGLNSKVKKKFDKVDAIDNISIEYVDLGLPSGNLWARYNVGSSDKNNPGKFLNHKEAVDASEQYGCTLPRLKDFFELNKHCTLKWARVIYDGDSISGLIATSKHNGNSIFFPAGGHFDRTYNKQVEGFNVFGHYWSADISDSKMPGNYFMAACMIEEDVILYNTIKKWHCREIDTMSVRLIIKKKD